MKLRHWLIIAALVSCLLIIAEQDRQIKLRNRVIREYETKNTIPSITDIQKMIGVTPDGIIGKETLEKWNRKICDQHAIKYFE